MTKKAPPPVLSSVKMTNMHSYMLPSFSSIISLASKLKNILANGDSIAKVSVEGCVTHVFSFSTVYVHLLHDQ